MASNLSLLDLDQDTFCKVIEQLQPIQAEQLLNLFRTNGRFISRILPCVNSIDFTDGTSLIGKNGLVSNIRMDEYDEKAVQLARLLFYPSELNIVNVPDEDESDESDELQYLDKYTKIIGAFPYLREYRISFTSYNDESENSDVLKEFTDLIFLLQDVRARWLFFIAPVHQQWESKFIDLIISGLADRVEKYGNDFTFAYELDEYEFSFHNGVLSLIMKDHIPVEHRDALRSFIGILSPVINVIGSNDSSFVNSILSTPTALNHVKRIIMFDIPVFDQETGQFVRFWDLFKINDLYPHLNSLTEVEFRLYPHLNSLTEVEFRLGYRYHKFPKRLPNEYIRPLLDRRRLNPGLSFPQITKFEIPIPLSLNDLNIFQNLFPNVPRFYHIEEYNLSRKYSQVRNMLRDRYDDDSLTPRIENFDRID
jgi:hypothetical protein